MGPLSKSMAIPSSKSVRTGLTFLLSFGLGKGAAFCAALALPRLADANLYGTIELALTVGMLGAAVLGLGAPAAAVKQHLVDDDPRADAVLSAHCVWLCALALMGAGLVGAVDPGAAYLSGIAMIGLVGFQSSATAYARMRGHIHLSGWLESSTIFLVFVIVGILFLTHGTRSSALLWQLIAVVALLGIANLVFFLRSRPADTAALAVEIVRVGTPMMIFGLSQILLFGTSRIAIARELSLADVAAFSLCARIALVLVFVSQVPSIGLFRSVYRLTGDAIARYFALWILVLSAISFGLCVAAHFGANLAVVGTDIPAAAFAYLFPAVAIQTTLWVLNSNLEMFIVRELLSRPAAIACFVIVAAGLAVGAALLLAGHLNLMVIIGIYSAAMLAMLVVQMRLLARKGAEFRNAYLALPLTAAPALLYLLPAAG